MMTLLAGGLKALAGPYLGTLTVPAMVLGLVIMGHQLVGARDSRLRAEATNVCDKGWESEIRQQERDAAAASAVAAQNILQGERNMNEGLRNELDKLQSEAAALRAANPAGIGDPDSRRCLSDGMLRALGGNERPGKGAGAAGRAK